MGRSNPDPYVLWVGPAASPSAFVRRQPPDEVPWGPGLQRTGNWVSSKVPTLLGARRQLTLPCPSHCPPPILPLPLQKVGTRPGSPLPAQSLVAGRIRDRRGAARVCLGTCLGAALGRLRENESRRSETALVRVRD